VERGAQPEDCVAGQAQPGLLKDLTDLPVGAVTLTDAQREQIRKMLEGQKLTQIKGLDRALLKKLVDAPSRPSALPKTRPKISI
jgi:hypothetical protein